MLILPLQSAYQCAWCYLQRLHSSWRELLGAQRDSTPDRERQSDKDSSGGEESGTEGEEEEGQVCGPEKQLESAITVYFRRVCSRQDMTPIAEVTRTYCSQT